MDIAEFYTGANIFITGGTGFVGLCLIEKLLRCVPGVGEIFLLIREKNKKGLHLRVNDLMQNQIFNSLKANNGISIFQKLHPVSGDITVPNLELNLEDEAILIKKINIVFHCAANLDFNENLRNSINANLLGTQRVIDLCKKFDDLKAFIHVSTAYVNVNHKYAKEVLYPFSCSNDKIISLVDNLDDKTINHIMPAILSNSPNVYTFTKGLAEYEVASVNNLFPTVIIRPSMITGAWKEPEPGWTSSKNGPQGFLMAAAKGIVRRLPVNKYLIYDYIPVDIVVNEIISSAWYVTRNRPKETLILHCTTSTTKPFRWCDLETHIPKMLNNYPLLNATWYPTLKFVSSLWLYRISAFIFHLIPAYIFDSLTRLHGHKPMLVRLHTNINKSLELLAPFIFNEWKFDNTNTLMLHQSLTFADQHKFGVDVKCLVWKEYFSNLALGIRQYLHNENISNLAAAKTKNRYLWILNMCVQLIVIQILFFMVHMFSDSVWYKSIWCIPAIVFFLNYL